MSRRAIVLCSVIAVFLIAVIGWLLAGLFGEDTVKRTGDTDIIHAVPTDALLVYEVNSLSDAEGVVALFAPDFFNFMSSLPGWARISPAVFSVHKSGRNVLAGLLACKIPEGESCDFGDPVRSYNSTKIYSSARSGFSYAVSGHFLLASASANMIEAALRHLETGETLMDDEAFANAFLNASGDRTLLINDAASGKLISSVFGRSFRKHSFFASSISDWIGFGIDEIDGVLHGTGVCSHLDDASEYSTVFRNQKGRGSDIGDVLPNVVRSCVSLRLSDQKLFSEDYSRWLSAFKHKSTDLKEAQSWADRLGIREVSRIVLPVGGKNTPVVLLKCASGDNIFRSDDIEPFVYASHLSSLFGELFECDGECYLAHGPRDWYVVGPRVAVEYLSSLWNSPNFFPVNEYMDQTPVGELFPKHCTFCAMLNFTEITADSVASVMNESYADIARSVLSRHNLEVFTVEMNSDGSVVSPSFVMHSCDLSTLPVHRRPILEGDEAASSDFVPLSVPEGPFTVIDFRNGSKNTLEQLEDGSLKLSDSRKRTLWTIPFDGTVCGYVSQIDYLKNKKLQMLFAAGSRLHLLSRLGKEVAPYPVETGREILLGPAVIDLNSDGNYTLIVLHSDNTLAQYDRDGKPVAGRDDMTAVEQIMGLPEVYSAAGRNYWVVRTAVETIVFTEEGLMVAEFRKKKRLAPDTELVGTDDENVVSVTGIDGKSLLLDLKKGVITNND